MRRRYIAIAFAVYLTLLLRITVFRSGFSIDNFLSGGNVNLSLFADLIKVAMTDIGSFIYLFVGNLVWFVPFGLLLPLLGVKRWLTLLLGTLFTFFIEAMQYIFAVGVTELDDLILNTLGCIIGIGAYSLIKHINERKKICQRKSE